MNINYDSKIEEILKNNIGKNILLHSCCAPCSSYVITYLSRFVNITVLYYNPNIYPKIEYDKRKKEQIKFINSIKSDYKINYMDCDYDNDLYEQMIKGLENEPERGSRCTKCFYLRLSKTAQEAKKNNFDFFCTTLTLSPYKNAKLINKIGFELQNSYNIEYLASDFKKRDGYKKSIELSKEYNLYRQNYCGCKYSIRKEDKNEECEM